MKAIGTGRGDRYELEVQPPTRLARAVRRLAAAAGLGPGSGLAGAATRVGILGVHTGRAAGPPAADPYLPAADPR